MTASATSLGRRRFLRSAVGASGALALGGVVLPESPLGAQPASLPGAARGGTARSLKDFQPFAPSPLTGAKSPLPRRVGFVAPTLTEYMSSLSDACRAACKSRGLEFAYALSDGDPVKNIDQLNQMLQRGVGGLVIPPLDAAAQAEIARRAIDAGVCVMFLVTPPCSTQTMSYQYLFGAAQGQAAVSWINQHVPGKGKVVYFNRDQFEALQPRTVAVRKVLAAAGIDLVLNRLDDKATQAEGFRLASLLAQSHPEVNVWLGEDDTMLGVDAFLQSRGHDPLKNDIALISVGGTDAAKKIVGTRGSFLRTVIASPDALSLYACGLFCADWLDGKTIPQAIEVGCAPLSSREEVTAFAAINADPMAAINRSLAGKYEGLRFWGAIDYETRGNYLHNIIDG